MTTSKDARPAKGHSQPGDAHRRGRSFYIVTYLKGLAMGSADVIPGVSGGTIALICGVYMELVEAIRNVISPHLRGIFQRGGFARYLRAVHWDFMLALGLGILTALMLFSRLILNLLNGWPVLVWSFFFGLILASVWFVGKEVKRWDWRSVLFLLVGGGIGLWVSLAVPGSLPEGALWYFISGAIAICAMILPGISGSFVLLLLGKYELVLEALHALNFAVIVPFALGCIVGIVSFSHLLSWLLRRYYSLAVALLTGFMLGAIVRVWPWQAELAATADAPSTFTLLMPNRYAELVGGQCISVWWALLMVVLGLGVVVVLEWLSTRSATSNETSK